jgi:uncharacterized repeat protein (TIGR01451 family)
VTVRRLQAADGAGPGLVLQDLESALVTESVITRNAVGVAVVQTPASRAGSAGWPRRQGRSARAAVPADGIVLGGAPEAGNSLSGNLVAGLALDNQTGSREPTADVDARYNNWGVAFTADIEALVRHQPDDAGLGRVTYLPALGVPERLTLSAEPPRLVADGQSTSQLRAEVSDPAGLPVADGALVALATDRGSLAPQGQLAEAESAALRRQGDWSLFDHSAFGPFSGTGFLRSRDPGARLAWTFEAPALGLGYGQAVSAAALYRVEVDGQDLGLFSTLGPERSWAWRLLARDLGPGAHTVTLTLQAGELNVDALAGGQTTLRGVVTARLRSATSVGSAQVSASAWGAGGRRGAQLELPFTAGSATSLRLWLAEERLPVGGVTTTVVAEPTDEAGRAVPDGTPVRFSVSRGTIEPSTALVAHGRATAVVRSGAELGEAVVRAESGGAVVTATLAFVPGRPARLEIVPGRPSLAANSQASTGLVLSVRDAWGHPVADGTPVTLTASLGTLAETSLRTDAGSAGTSLRAGAVAGPGRVTATSGPATAAITISLIAPDLRITKHVEPRSVVVPGEKVTYTLVAANVGSGTVYDALITDLVPAGLITITDTAIGLPNLRNLGPPPYRWRLDRLRPGERGAITLTLLVDPERAWEPRTQVPNEARFFSPSAAERTPEDNVARSVLEVVPFAAFTVTLTAPERLMVGGTTGPVLARVVDRAGRPAPDGTRVYFSTDLGSVTPISATTRGGVARVTFVTGTQSGIAAVRAETQEERGATAFVRVVAGPPQRLELVSERPWLHVGGDRTVVTATLSDAFNNPNVGEPIRLSTSRGGFDTRPPSDSFQAFTGLTGQVTGTLVSGALMGEAIVSAQHGMLLKRIAVPFRPGPPALLSIRLSTDQANVGDTVVVTGRVTDVYENPTAGVPVTFTTTVGWLGDPTADTDAAGEARSLLHADVPGFGLVSVNGIGRTAFTVLAVQRLSIFLPFVLQPRR